jgi:hypothetical protein
VIEEEIIAILHQDAGKELEIEEEIIVDHFHQFQMISFRHQEEGTFYEEINNCRSFSWLGTVSFPHRGERRG